MVDLGKYEKPTMQGTITQVREMTLREYLELRHGLKAPKIIEKFNEETLDRQHLIIDAKSDGAELDWFGMIPTVQGYNRSNLKRVKERNKLPNNTKKWVGKSIELRVDDKSGFLRVAV